MINMKIKLSGVVLLSLLILNVFPGQGFASFIGQDIQISHELSFYPVGSPWDEVHSVNVTNDDSDSVFIFNGITSNNYTIGYWVNFNESTLNISWDFDQTRIYSGTHTRQSINGLHVLGLETEFLENITDISFASTDFNFSDSQERIFVLPNENRMMFDFAGLTVNPTSEISFVFEFHSVPEPSSLYLLLIGVLFIIAKNTNNALVGTNLRCASVCPTA
jgi:hypothetical protein